MTRSNTIAPARRSYVPVARGTARRHRRRRAAAPVLVAMSAMIALVTLPFFVQAGGAKGGDTLVAGTTAGVPATAAHQGQPPREQGSAPGESGSDGSGPAAEETGGAPAGTTDEVTPQPPPDQVGAGAGPCADALTWVAGAGLSLPAGVGYHCPSSEFPHHGAA